MPSFLFRCFPLFLLHFRTLAHEKWLENCVFLGLVGRVSLSIIVAKYNFFPALTMAARAKKNFWQSDLLTPSASTLEIWSTLTYTEFVRGSASYVIICLLQLFRCAETIFCGAFFINYSIISPGWKIGSWPVVKLPNGSLILFAKNGQFCDHLNYWILMFVVMTTKVSWLKSLVISFGLFN